LILRNQKQDFQLQMQHYWTHNSFGARSFSAGGPRVWNSLPPHLRQDMSFARLQQKLKTFYFVC